MGGSFSRREEPVSAKYVGPNGLYKQCDWDQRIITKLITEKKLAPRFPGAEDALGSEFEECPICMMYYPGGLNRSRCCRKGICTECFLQVKRKGVRTPATCPFCAVPSYGVVFLGPQSDAERQREFEEDQKVLELQIKMRSEQQRQAQQQQPAKASLPQDVPAPAGSSAADSPPDASPRELSVSAPATAMLTAARRPGDGNASAAPSSPAPMPTSALMAARTPSIGPPPAVSRSSPALSASPRASKTPSVLRRVSSSGGSGKPGLRASASTGKKQWPPRGAYVVDAGMGVRAPPAERVNHRIPHNVSSGALSRRSAMMRQRSESSLPFRPRHYTHTHHHHHHHHVHGERPTFRRPPAGPAASERTASPEPTGLRPRYTRRTLDDALGADLEEIMVMEAVRLSLIESSPAGASSGAAAATSAAASEGSPSVSASTAASMVRDASTPMSPTSATPQPLSDASTMPAASHPSLRRMLLLAQQMQEAQRMQQHLQPRSRPASASASPSPSRSRGASPAPASRPSGLSPATTLATPAPATTATTSTTSTLTTTTTAAAAASSTPPPPPSSAATALPHARVGSLRVSVTETAPTATSSPVASENAPMATSSPISTDRAPAAAEADPQGSAVALATSKGWMLNPSEVDEDAQLALALRLSLASSDPPPVP